MALIVVQPGASTTVQDRGRVGFREFGVPVGGAFDQGSLDLANALLGNDPDAAALEMTLVGGVYRAEVALAIALAGAPMSAAIREPSGRERPLRIPQSTTLRTGEKLVLGGSPLGARTYLAIRGGWLTPVVLGSRSTETRLNAGDLLHAEPSSTLARRPVSWPWAAENPNRTHSRHRRPRRRPGSWRCPAAWVGRVPGLASIRPDGLAARREADRPRG